MNKLQKACKISPQEELLTFLMFKTMFFNKLHEILHTQEMHGNMYDGYIEGELINKIFNEMEEDLK